ncbi:galactokinase [Edaphobacter sp. 12200R-103]|uniref:galactokinase n=1 Tax=Edaphobacter sp. 12200R-103 TaxID=2703788 RepID=UPI00138D118E|nr:galactokinase [Edaphobacter sp. 12200R-103]QHS51274.1 galactokinase [Edaphobacter sp. 12200R-103]
MKLTDKAVQTAHEDHFGQPGKLFRAPARVNLIGEHTDYTGGLVMPMAIDFQTIAVISPREDKRLAFYSHNYGEETIFDLKSLERGRQGHWSDYPAGVAWSLWKEGIRFGGFNITLSGDVPLGAGLSSSASVEVAAAMAILSLSESTLPLAKLATLCRRAENEFVGAKSGIMDQFVVAGAVAHRAMMLDTRSLEFDLLPLPDDVRVVIANSMVRHAVATGEYGNRRDEVEAGQAVLQQECGVALLRDATLADLGACRDRMSPESFARCRHIITENERVLQARDALLESDMPRFGELMVKAHTSMRDDFAASCEEVDTLVEIALRQSGCIGARITGGGFGGCTVNIVKASEAEAFVSAVQREYAQATKIEADCFICEPADGALALAKKGGVA